MNEAKQQSRLPHNLVPEHQQVDAPKFKTYRIKGDNHRIVAYSPESFLHQFHAGTPFRQRGHRCGIHATLCPPSSGTRRLSCQYRQPCYIPCRPYFPRLRIHRITPLQLVLCSRSSIPTATAFYIQFFLFRLFNSSLITIKRLLF